MSFTSRSSTSRRVLLKIVMNSDQEQEIRDLLTDGQRQVWDRLSLEDKDFYVEIADDMGAHWAAVAFVADGGKGPFK